MKGIMYLSSMLGISLVIGCQSTTHDVAVDKQKEIKYESRCDSQIDQSNLALVRIAPQYPVKALKSETEGYVTMEFDISEGGSPININVVESYPNDLFINSATNALSKWLYKPPMRKCLIMTLEFKLG
ncbi:MAG: TonB family protein [Alteromonadaceae bacterium]|jgi:TonB family protein